MKNLEKSNFDIFLAENLEKIKNYEELFCDIINTSHQMFENKGYLTPAEKHILVKVMGFCIFLIDSEQVNVNKLDQKRLVHPQHYVKSVFREIRFRT